MVAAGTGATRRITGTPALERYASRAPDWRAPANASERHGTWDIVEERLARDGDARLSGAAPVVERVLIGTPDDEVQPAWSPDGGRIADRHDRTQLRVLDLAPGASVIAPPRDASCSCCNDDHSFAWRPDGR